MEIKAIMLLGEKPHLKSKMRWNIGYMPDEMKQ